MGRQVYSDAEKQEAVILLAYHKYNFANVAKLTGVPPQTLRKWNKQVPKKSVPEMLERAIEHLLAQLPYQIPAKDYGIIAGILLDKWLIVKGLPTARTESAIGRLGEMNEAELDNVIRQAEDIIRRAVEGGSAVDLPGESL